MFKRINREVYETETPFGVARLYWKMQWPLCSWCLYFCGSEWETGVDDIHSAISLAKDHMTEMATLLVSECATEKMGGAK